VKAAEYPERKCREPFSEDGLIDHTCDVVDAHPGPHAAFSCPASVKRRDDWEAANPGWERMMSGTDPFAEVGAIPEEHR
jgi:hypothetical protein